MDRYAADLLLTMSGDQAPVPDGVVDVEEGRVVWSGPASEAPDPGDAMVLRVDGILMPGMVNIHCKARVPDMVEAGVRVGIGTDGPASHHRLDLFEEMRMAIRPPSPTHGYRRRRGLYRPS